MIGALGMIVFVALAWVASENRKAFPWRVALSGTVLQFVLALLMLKLPPLRFVFVGLSSAAGALLESTLAGSRFVFGYLAGGPAPFTVAQPSDMFILAFQALVLILPLAAIFALLYYWRILPFVVRAFAALFRVCMGVAGPSGLAVAANILLGMVEAPLCIRPYLARMSRCELFIVMTSGMATIAGTMLVLYATILEPVIPQAMGQILTASLISAPAAIVTATVMIPPRGAWSAGGSIEPDRSANAMDAMVSGVMNGLSILVQVAALLLVFVALVDLADKILSLAPAVGGQALSVQRIFGFAFRPVVWLMGVPWSEAGVGGSLMGTKVALNEFLAYLDMARLPAGALSDRSRVILTYAMCGFANFGSVGIIVGGMRAMVPERAAEIAGLGAKSLAAGVLATCMTGCVVGLIL
ncbi:MAG: concentrative nucleoside transporter, family [Desulfovibrionales bacterium]|nr:concentrative nucleoside transporter, family [Desulfovibrionales bacterium]